MVCFQEESVTELADKLCSLFFTIVNPMDNQDGLGENPMRFVTSKNRDIQNTWKRFQNTVSWCNLKLAQERGL